MSYNIDSVDTISGQLFLTPAAALALKIKIGESELPESNILDDSGFLGEGDEGEPQLDDDYYGEDKENTPVAVKVSWSGTYSGRSYEHLVEKVLPATTGSADLIFYWEGGDSFSGLRVVEGVVTKHEVVMTLGDEEKG